MMSSYPHDGRDYATLVHCADHAMYRAKSMGKNQWVRYHRDFSSMSSSPSMELPRAPESRR